MKVSADFFALVAVLVLGGAGAAFWWSQHEPASPRRSSSPVSARGDAAGNERAARNDRELDALNEQVGSLRAELQNVRDSAVKASHEATLPAVMAAAPPSPRSREEQERAWNEHVRGLDQAFEAEPIDTQWSTQMASSIRAAASGDELTSGLVQGVECRSSSCRLSLSDGTRRKLDQAVEHLILEFAGELPNASVGHNGDLAAPKPSALYLARARPEDGVPLFARQ